MLRVLVLVGPVIAFVVTRRICIGLQRRDAEVVVHGYETGIITRSADGGYTERHLPISPAEAWSLTDHDRVGVAALPPATDDNGVPGPGTRAGRMRARLSAFWVGHYHPEPTAAAARDARRHEEAEPVREAVDEEFGGVDELGVPRRR